MGKPCAAEEVNEAAHLGGQGNGRATNCGEMEDGGITSECLTTPIAELVSHSTMKIEVLHNKSIHLYLYCD
ncbi:hypothetical protein QR680_002874 [Steinernema hermaphroditum]|uniref:Uncharacterized protein n=1 Tax=Steinernema hermaphroditum TaxID=289476 RepID=A0AA39H597_9BILA|nr:hypothetical protein QR680_002874 [Steinernema hermaphroditum]